MATDKGMAIDFKLILLLVALIIFSAAGSGYVVYLVFDGGQGRAGTAAEAPPARSDGSESELGAFTVNLAGTGGLSSRYLRATVTVELSDKAAVQELTALQAQVRDRVIDVMRRRTAEELASVDGTEALRKEIVAAINALLTKGRALDVFFTEFIIQ